MSTLSRRAGRRGRWGRVAVVAALSALAPALPGPAAGAAPVPRPADGTFVVDGRGFGHGRGMSQHGAYGAALQGRSHAEILGFYYPQAVLGTAAGTVRRVLLTAEDADLDVVNTAGLRLRDTAGGAVVDLGAKTATWPRVRVRADPAGLVAEGLAGGAWVPVPVGRAATGVLRGPVVLEGPPVLTVQRADSTRAYRGQLVAALSGQPARPLYAVNHVGLDDYVRGVVPAEMPALWPQEAVKAQAVAARSYGMQACPQSAYPATQLYDVVDTTACQVYGGVRAEHPASDQAVAATAGQVLRVGGAVLRTEFSSSNGGWTVPGAGAPTPREDPYDAVGARAAGSAVNRWTGVRVPAATLEAAFGTGPLQSVTVLERDGRGEWSGRVLRVRLTGAARTVDVTGAQVRAAAGLRSTWFDVAPPPVTAPSAIAARHRTLGGDGGFLGAAVTGELVTPDRAGRYTHYRGGSIYWHPRTGAHEVHGRIRDTWARLGWERSALGYPVTDELPTPDRVGRFSHFERGSVYWSPATDAREVRGAIRDAWARLGWERSALGYPTSDEYAVPGGRAGDFQRGRITWDAATGRTTVTTR